jgi:hypothetical protein
VGLCSLSRMANCLRRPPEYYADTPPPLALWWGQIRVHLVEVKCGNKDRVPIKKLS